jgi:hypothetical protein
MDLGKRRFGVDIRGIVAPGRGALIYRLKLSIQAPIIVLDIAELF